MTRVLILASILCLLTVGSTQAQQPECRKLVSFCSTTDACIDVSSVPNLGDPACETSSDGFVPLTQNCGSKKHWLIFAKACGGKLGVNLCEGGPHVAGCLDTSDCLSTDLPGVAP
jgi:hypothetical protein